MQCVSWQDQLLAWTHSLAESDPVVRPPVTGSELHHWKSTGEDNQPSAPLRVDWTSTGAHWCTQPSANDSSVSSHRQCKDLQDSKQSFQCNKIKWTKYQGEGHCNSPSLNCPWLPNFSKSPPCFPFQVSSVHLRVKTQKGMNCQQCLYQTEKDYITCQPNIILPKLNLRTFLWSSRHIF